MVREELALRLLHVWENQHARAQYRVQAFGSIDREERNRLKWFEDLMTDAKSKPCIRDEATNSCRTHKTAMYPNASACYWYHA